MTAFFERITEAPRVYDAARGDDALRKPDRGAGRDSRSRSCRRAPRRGAKASRAACRDLLLLPLSHLARAARSRDARRMRAARSRRASDAKRARSLPPPSPRPLPRKEVMALLRRYKRRMALLDRARRSRRRLADRDDARGHERDGRRGAASRRPRFCSARRARPARSRRKPTRRRRPAISSSPWASSARSS